MVDAQSLDVQPLAGEPPEITRILHGLVRALPKTPPIGTPPIRVFGRLLGRRNEYYQGDGVIKGETRINDVVVGVRQVRLHDKKTGALVQETWSDPLGAYAFYNLDTTKEYYAVAHDHTRVYNGVISDMLTAAP